MRATTLSVFFSIMIGLITAAHAAEFNDGQRKEIESVVREYLLNNPEILQEISQTLEQKQKQAEDEQRKGALVANAELIFRDKADFVAGNPNGNVTMVEFFDYCLGSDLIGQFG